MGTGLGFNGESVYGRGKKRTQDRALTSSNLGRPPQSRQEVGCETCRVPCTLYHVQSCRVLRRPVTDPLVLQTGDRKAEAWRGWDMQPIRGGSASCSRHLTRVDFHHHIMPSTEL